MIVTDIVVRSFCLKTVNFRHFIYLLETLQSTCPEMVITRTCGIVHLLVLEGQTRPTPMKIVREIEFYEFYPNSLPDELMLHFRSIKPFLIRSLTCSALHFVDLPHFIAIEKRVKACFGLVFAISCYYLAVIWLL